MRLECGAAGSRFKPVQVTTIKTRCCRAIEVILGVMATLATLFVVSISVNALLIVAASSDRLWSWSCGYLLSASVSAALLTGGAVLIFHEDEGAPTPMWSGTAGPGLVVEERPPGRAVVARADGYNGLSGLVRKKVPKLFAN